MPAIQPRMAGLILGLIGITCFALTLTAARAALPELGAVLVGPGRAVAAAIPAALFLLWRRPHLPDHRELGQLALMSLGIIFGFPLLSSLALETVPAGHGAVMLGILPLTTALAAILVAGERPSAGFWLTNILGALAVTAFALRQGGMSVQLADLWLLLAVASASYGYTVGGVLARKLDAADVISWGLVLSAPVMAPLVWATTGVNWQASAAAWAGFAYVALVSQYFGFFAWYKAMALAGVARTGQLQLFQPFITIASAALLIGEAVDTATVIFALVVAVIVAAGQKMQIGGRKPAL